MKKFIFIFLTVLMSGCNNTLLLTSESPAKVSVVAPSQMYIGDCTAWAVRLFSSNDKTARAEEDTTIGLSINSNGATAPGAGLYSDSSCTQSISSLDIPTSSVYATFYVKYNLVGSLTVNATASNLQSGTHSVTTLLSYRRVSRFAGAGEGWGNYEGVGSEARINALTAIASDGTYIYGVNEFYHQVHRVEIATKRYTKFAGLMSTAGTTDGIGTSALFNGPTGVAYLNGYLYVADKNNHTIRRINVNTQEVTTVAGLASTAGHTDGIGSAARFNQPHSLTTDGTYLYISSETHTIRRLDPSNFSVTTLAGVGGTSGTANGIGTAARFNKPAGLSTDGTFLYIADSTNHTIRMLELSTNTVTTIAGTAAASGSADGVGAAARFSTPYSVTHNSGTLYIADRDNNTLRAMNLSTSQVTTYLGDASGTDDYVRGTFANSRFWLVRSVVIIGTTMYLVDYNPVITKIDMVSQTTEDLIGVTKNRTWSSLDGTGTNARFNFIDQMISDGTYIYIPDVSGHAIRRLSIATGVVDTIAGTIDTSGSTNGIGSAARFNTPSGIAISGNILYIADNGNRIIRKIDLSTFQVTTLAGSAGLAGTTNGTGSAARFSRPGGLAINGNDLYVCDYGGRNIRKINVTTAVVTTVAGTAGSSGTVDGIGTAARFRQPFACVVFGNYLYIGDYEALNIRKMDLTTLEVTTVAGLADTRGFADGVGSNARFTEIYSVTTDGTSLYFTDINNHSIRKLNPQTEEVTTFLGQTEMAADRESSFATATAAWPSSIVWTQQGMFFSNDGVGISWIH